MGRKQSALVVELRHAEAHLYRCPGRAVEAHAGVALLLCTGELSLKAGGQALVLGLEVVVLGLEFLQTDHVGRLLGQPVEGALVGRRTDAVGIETDHTHVVYSRRT